MQTHRQLFRLISWYYFRRHRGRTLLTIITMMLGMTAMFMGIATIPGSRSGLASTANMVSGKAQLVVQAAGSLTADDLETIRQTDGVKTASPLVTSGGIVLGEADPLVFWGIDPASERDIREYVTIQGDFPTAGSVFVTETYANERQLTVGQSIQLVGLGGIQRVTVGGILQTTGIVALNGGDLVAMHYQDVQTLRGDGTMDSVWIIAEPDQNIANLAERLRQNLPDSVQIDSPENFYKKPLAAWVADALMVFTNSIPVILGALIIFNTLAAAVAQRRAEIGVLRALGLTRGGIRALFLVESAVLGFIGSVLGILLACLGPVNTNAVEVSGYEMEVAITVPAWTPLVALALGIGIALLAGLIPARQAARVDPIEAMTRRNTVQTRRSWGSVHKGRWLRIVLGAFCLFSLIPLRAALDMTEQAMMMPLLSALLVSVGGVLLFPSFMVLLSQQLPGIIGNRLGPSVLLAAESLAKRPQNMGAAGMMVFIVIWFIGMGTGIAESERTFIQDYAAVENTWDLQIIGPGADANRPLTSIPEGIVTAISKRPAVAGVVTERSAVTSWNDHDYALRGLDIANLRALDGRIMVIEGDEEAAYARLQDSDHPALLVGGSTALIDGIKRIGSHVVLDTPATDPPQTAFEIVGVVGGATDVFVIDQALYRRLWDDAQVDRLLVKLQPGADIQAERRDLLRRYAQSGIQVVDRETIQAMMRPPMAGTTEILALMLMPFMILGIANTLFINILDRRREIGMLRAVGTLRRQITASIIGETLILTGIACVLAVPAAYYALDMMLFDRITGVPTNIKLSAIALTVVYLVLGSLLAVFLPARRAGRIDVLAALHYE